MNGRLLQVKEFTNMTEPVYQVGTIDQISRVGIALVGLRRYKMALAFLKNYILLVGEMSGRYLYIGGGIFDPSGSRYFPCRSLHLDLQSFIQENAG